MSGIIGSKFNHRGSGLVGSLGTDGQHMLSSGAGKKNVFETVSAATYDDEPIKSDLTALALREATNEASVAFNLPNSFIETFTDDTNLGTETDGGRKSGYWRTTSEGTADYTTDSYASGDRQSIIDATHFQNGGYGIFWTGGDVEHTIDGTTSGGSTVMDNVSQGFIGAYLQYDFGAGNARIVQAVRHYNDVDYGHDARIDASNDNVTYTTLGASVGIGTGSPIEPWSFADNSTAYRYWRFVGTGDGSTSGGSLGEVEFKIAPVTTNATGTLIQSANAVTGTRTEVGGTFLYKDNEGTATLGSTNDLAIYFTCDGGSNWTEAASYNAITPVYSTGIKQVRLGETTCTGGTDVRYKAVWANQSGGSLETQLHGIGINY